MSNNSLISKYTDSPYVEGVVLYSVLVNSAFDFTDPLAGVIGQVMIDLADECTTSNGGAFSLANNRLMMDLAFFGFIPEGGGDICRMTLSEAFKIMHDDERLARATLEWTRTNLLYCLNDDAFDWGLYHAWLGSMRIEPVFNRHVYDYLKSMSDTGREHQMDMFFKV